MVSSNHKMISFVPSSDLEASSRKGARFNTRIGRPRGSLQVWGSSLKIFRSAGNFTEDV